MKPIKIYPIRSLMSHGGMISSDSEKLLTSLKELLEGYEFSYIDSFSSLKEDDFLLILVQSGGSEGIFKEEVYPNFKGPYHLLTYGSSNSLAASLEILSFLKANGEASEVLHGDDRYIANRILALMKAKTNTRPSRLGVFGMPSDWLISSNVDYQRAKKMFNIDLIDIKESEMIETILSSSDSLEGIPNLTYEEKELRLAMKIYHGLSALVKKYELDGFTIRCFGLLSAVHSSSCLALALFNQQDIVASCEGDVPALLTAYLMQQKFHIHCFQANPQWIDPIKNQIDFAHCTLPLDMARSVSLDTHFESGIGIGIHGEMEEGPVTVLKISADLGLFYCEEGTLIGNDYRKDRCRTQIRLKMDAPVSYFLTSSLGNHHQILYGHHKKEIEEYLKNLGLREVEG